MADDQETPDIQVEQMIETDHRRIRLMLGAVNNFVTGGQHYEARSDTLRRTIIIPTGMVVSSLIKLFLPPIILGVLTTKLISFLTIGGIVLSAIILLIEIYTYCRTRSNREDNLVQLMRGSEALGLIYSFVLGLTLLVATLLAYSVGLLLIVIILTIIILLFLRAFFLRYFSRNNADGSDSTGIAAPGAAGASAGGGKYYGGGEEEIRKAFNEALEKEEGKLKYILSQIFPELDEITFDSIQSIINQEINDLNNLIKNLSLRINRIIKLKDRPHDAKVIPPEYILRGVEAQLSQISLAGEFSTLFARSVNKSLDDKSFVTILNIPKQSISLLKEKLSRFSGNTPEMKVPLLSRVYGGNTKKRRKTKKRTKRRKTKKRKSRKKTNRKRRTTRR